MRGLGLLLRKELLGMHRTGRLWIALALFAALGLASPLLARLLPELLSALPADQMRGVEILLTRTPDLTDALGQYHKNMTLIPLVLVLLGMGSLSSERGGTAALLLRAGAGRLALLLAKLLAQLVVAALGTALAAACFTLYASALFSPPDALGFAALNGIYLAIFALISAVTLLGAALGRGQGAAAAAGIVAFLALSALAAIPSLAAATPAGLFGIASALIGGETCEPTLPLLSAAAATVLCWITAFVAFSREEL